MAAIVDTIIVIPCYNEESRLQADAFLAFVEESSAISFLFVDDGSTDSTLDVLEGLAHERPNRFAVLPLKTNQGKAEAVRQGILRGLTREPAFIGYWDADLSPPLDAIPLLIDVLKSQPSTQMVLGTRLRSLGRVIVRNPFRHYAGRVVATGISLITGLHVYDSQCGAKLLRVTPTLDGVFNTPFVSSWFFDVEILVRLSEMHSARTRTQINRLFYEVPLPRWVDVRGSKVCFGDMVSVPLDLLRIWMKY